MMITPTEIRITEDRRQDLFTAATRERRAATVVAPALPWRTLAFRVVAFVALCLGAPG